MPPYRPISDRFWEKVDKTDPEGCWPWLASIKENGYGQLGAGAGSIVYAHRVAYELAVGPIPEGMTIDHLCSNRSCCRPEHLEAVTRSENSWRGCQTRAANIGVVARRRSLPAPVACHEGHALDGANLRVSLSKSAWFCRRCEAERKRRERLTEAAS